MFEKFTTVDANDFRQRYLGTYGFFRRGENKPLLTKINAIDRAVTFVDRDGISYSLNPDTDSDIGFEFIPPKAAWHNTNEGAYLVKRIPARQWLRGVHTKNTQIMTPHGSRAAVDFPILEQIYGKTVARPAALKQFQEGKGRTCFLAISEQFAVDFAKNGVWCMDIKIGNYKWDNLVFKVELDDQELWQTELRDAFNRAGLKMEIVE